MKIVPDTYLKASFTVESSVVFFIMFVAIGNLILYVLEKERNVSYMYATHYSLTARANYEEVFDVKGKKDEEQDAKLRSMFEDITNGGERKAGFKSFRTGSKVGLSIESGIVDGSMEQSIFKPIDFMRLMAGIEGIFSKEGILNAD